MLAHDEVACDHQSRTSKTGVTMNENATQLFDVRVHTLHGSKNDVVLRRRHVWPRKLVVGHAISHQIPLSVVRISRIREDAVRSAKRVFAFFLQIEDSGDFVCGELIDVVELGEETSGGALRRDDEIADPVRVQADDGGFLRGLIFVGGCEIFDEVVELLFGVVFVFAGEAAAGDAAMQILAGSIEEGFDDGFVEVAPLFLVDVRLVFSRHYKKQKQKNFGEFGDTKNTANNNNKRQNGFL